MCNVDPEYDSIVSGFNTRVNPMSLKKMGQVAPVIHIWDSIRDLMGEILKLISREDILAFSCVDKTSRAYAEPILYAKIEWNWSRSEPPPIGAFLRTILCRPELASYVRIVDLSGQSFGMEEPFSGRAPDVPDVSIAGLFLNHAIKAVEATKVPHARLWKRHIRAGKMDALVAVLLSQLHNVSHLTMCSNFTIESRLSGMLFSAALCGEGDYRLPTFRHLRYVNYRLRDSQFRTISGRNTANALPFFYLPGIQTLSVALDNPIAFGWITHLPDPSTITSLDLDSIRETHLGRILSVTRGLKSLTWDWFHNSQSRHSSNTPLIDLDEVATALVHVRNTLKQLSITADSIFQTGWGTYEFPVLEIKGSLTLLVDFNQLESLDIPLPFLASFTPKTGIQLEDVVPRNIKHLRITDDLEMQEKYDWDDTSLLRAIESWLNSSRASNPNLITISLCVNGKNSYWGLETRARREFQTLCDKHGVRAKVRKLFDGVGVYYGI